MDVKKKKKKAGVAMLVSDLKLDFKIYMRCRRALYLNERGQLNKI